MGNTRVWETRVYEKHLCYTIVWVIWEIRVYGKCGEGNTCDCVIGVKETRAYGKHWRIGNTGVWETLVYWKHWRMVNTGVCETLGYGKHGRMRNHERMGSVENR
ncbi:hypothetical protein DPMN_049427 [Dreissena polymorpha]|uniref:Uncharacterized protein n=1 Tax=Dreissena polymorpha TaxID=45954 RepID=A0A9D4CEC1_DREPO|nr:hypothetical protein DPMN_049427 [Dreissena polymorpha]